MITIDFTGKCNKALPRKVTYLVVVLPLLVSLAGSQTRALPHSTGEAQVQIYIADFTQVTPSVQLGDLGPFTAEFIRLRLLKYPALAVYRSVASPPCGGSLELPGNNASQASIGTLPKGPSLPDDFYVIHGSIDVHPPNIIIDYAVERCRSAKSSIVGHETQPFPAEQVLEQLASIARYIGFLLEERTPRTLVRIEPFYTDAKKEDQKKIAEGTTQAVSEAVSQSPDLDLSNKGEYIVAGSLRFSGGHILPVPTPWSQVETTLVIRSRRTNKKHTLPVVTGDRNGLDNFYARVSDAVLSGLKEQRLAERLGWETWLEASDLTELLTKSRVYLCIQQAPLCVQDLEAATAVLLVATQNYPDSYEALLRLGQTHLASERYGNATEVLRKSLALLDSQRTRPDSQDRAEILNALGDSYIGTRNYSAAVSAYQQSLETLPSQPSIFIKQARALRFDGNRKAALDILLRVGRTESAEQEMQDLIRDLDTAELEMALEAVRNENIKSGSLATEYAMLLVRRGGNVYDEAKTAEEINKAGKFMEEALSLNPTDDQTIAEANCYLALIAMDHHPDTANTYLTRAESIRSEKLPSSTREWILRVRAVYYMNSKHYSDAFQTTERARQVNQSSKSAALIESQVLLLWGRDDEQHGVSGDAIRSRYLQSSDLLKPLVIQRFGNADTLMQEVNHSLNRDIESRTLLTNILKNNPNDVSALRHLSFICNEYLYDFKCSHDALQQMVDGGLSERASDKNEYELDMIEVSILTGEYRSVKRPLEELLTKKDVTPALKAVASLYSLWAAVAEGHEDLTNELRTFRSSAEEFRRSGSLLNWSFRAAKHVLATGSLSDSKRTLLNESISVLEDNNRPLPAEPRQVRQ